MPMQRQTRHTRTRTHTSTHLAPIVRILGIIQLPRDELPPTLLLLLGRAGPVVADIVFCGLLAVAGPGVFFVDLAHYLPEAGVIFDGVNDHVSSGQKLGPDGTKRWGPEGMIGMNKYSRLCRGWRESPTSVISGTSCMVYNQRRAIEPDASMVDDTREFLRPATRA